MLLRISTEPKLLVANKSAACTKDVERRTKGVCAWGSEAATASRIFQQPAISQTGPLACEQKAT